jgi:hypothetical protein
MDCSVIIVSYNTRSLTLQCLDGLMARSKGVALQAIIVDNASEDGSADAIAAAFPGVDVLRNRQNCGFARAVNQACERATGRVLFLLNPDATVEEGTVEKLLEVLSVDPRLGAVGPMVLSPDGVPQHHCASRQISLARQLAWHFRFPTSRLFLGEVVGPHGARRTERLSGAAIAVRREVVREVGLLDERFFMYYEDADWVLRIRRAGYIVACVTDARVIHESGASARQDPLARSDRAIESELAYFAKHEGPVKTLLLRAGILVTSALRAVSLDAVLALRRDRRHRLLADLRAMRSCLLP